MLDAVKDAGVSTDRGNNLVVVALRIGIQPSQLF